MKKNSESGFALLLVYAMAATVAIMLYMQLPRVAFEAQREKEQLLIDRGEQYKRAVQLYVRKFQRFPTDIAALENTQNIRFLRKQYVDPMTGKNDWRIVHVGPGGAFTDSQVYSQQAKKDSAAPQNFITEMQQVGGNGTTTEGVNLATRKRPSDQAGAPGSQTANPGDPANPGNPGQPAGPVMVLPDGRIVPATPTGVPAPAGGQSGIPGQPGAQVPAMGGGPGAPGIQNPGQSVPGQSFPGQGFPGQNFPGQNFPGQPTQGGMPGAPPTGAANLINQILTTPRPLPGQGAQGGAVDAFGNAQAGTNGIGGNNTGTPLGTGMGGQVVGGGFAGVASKYEQEGIKSYNDRTAYNQWEFVYDMTKDPTRGVQTGVPAGGATPTAAGTGTIPGAGK